ncbi:MAG: DUF4960 domain-containing protein [Bacteroidaceae bacterium]|nr:DUF4960 domain-containing protein [Bacteroidaceae bacterium]
MMWKRFYLLVPLALLMMGACKQDGNIINVTTLEPTLTMDLMRSDLIKMKADGDTLTFSWPHLDKGNMMSLRVTRDGVPFIEQLLGNDVTSFVQRDVETAVQYVYTFRLTDGQSTSDAVVKTYTRQGAPSVKDLAVSQREGTEGYEAVLTWSQPAQTELIAIYAACGEEEVLDTIPGTETSYVLPALEEEEEWTFSVIACNESGFSLPSTVTLKVGKTAVAFVSYYATPEALVANGDDDEAAAWLWFHATYPNSRFLYFGDIHATADLADLRVLFYIRDLDEGTENDVWNQPQPVQDALPYITEWYREGGNLVLWQHATTFIGDLGRVSKTLLRNNDRRITTGRGSWNNDRWYMAVHANLAGRFYIDYSTHPLYNNVAVNGDRTVTVKSACFTEDHNCCFFNIPAALTGMHNQSADTYKVLTEVYGIYPLATWDNDQMNFCSMLNVWEARQGNTDFKGTVLCLGNGGLEFSHQHADGSPDKSAYPQNNAYQGNVLQIAKNAIEYLKTR